VCCDDSSPRSPQRTKVRLLLTARNQVRSARHHMALGGLSIPRTSSSTAWRQGEPTTRRWRCCAVFPVSGLSASPKPRGYGIVHCRWSASPYFYPHLNKFLGLLAAWGADLFLLGLRCASSIQTSPQWERSQRCMDIPREKRFRQRIVVGEGVQHGRGGTRRPGGTGSSVLCGGSRPYCGTSTSSSAGLFKSTVLFRGLKYGLAAEHAQLPVCCSPIPR